MTFWSPEHRGKRVHNCQYDPLYKGEGAVEAGSIDPEAQSDVR